MYSFSYVYIKYFYIFGIKLLYFIVLFFFISQVISNKHLIRENIAENGNYVGMIYVKIG